jgi:mRNA interferase HigB
MLLVNKKLLDDFTTLHADALQPVNRWIGIIEQANWANHNDLKADFPSADYVGEGRYVFNIKGNDYRIITVIVFVSGIAHVCFAGTHSEYSKINCLTVMQ